ncbi:MAG: AMP-binding protein, partial [Desulfobacterales bacterium]
MNLCEYLENSARKHPHKIVVRHEGDQLTYAELDRQCNRLANGLKDLGLSPGDRCVVMMPNHIDVITVYYALTKLGVVIVPVNFLFKQHELTHIFTDAQPKAFIGAEPYLDEIRRFFNNGTTPSIRLARGIADDPLFMDLTAAYADKDQIERYPADDDDTLKILYTSGTTGVPKGVMLTHGNLASEARILAEMRGTTDPETVVIGVLPLYHVYGITSVLNVSLYLGLTIELFTQFDPEKVIRVAAEENRTILFAVPTMYNRLIEIASQNPPARSSLKFCVSGGASLPVEFIHRFETLFDTKMYEGYGLTEAPVCVENPFGGLTKPGSIGLPIMEFSAKIIDPNGAEVSPGESGELLIKGPGVMKGYLNRPAETQETIKDGWLYTGDIACQDEEGYIYIVDRKKDLIIRGGYNIYPREIEEVMYQIPEILEAAVIGVADADLGEEIAAVVFLKEGAQIDTQTIQAYVKERVAPYKYPRVIDIISAPLPKSGTGKILKK